MSVDVLSFCSLPAGIIQWQRPAPSLTVIVKATFTLEHDGYAALAAAQEPLSLDRAGEFTERDELVVASDFVPLKSRVDVILTGHARSHAPAQVIPARLGVGALDKQLFAVAAEPSAAIPLACSYLRARAAADSDRVLVGARAPWSLERALLAGAHIAGSPVRAAFEGVRLVGPEGPPRAPLPANFDYRFFNSAPPDQQVGDSPAAAALVLDGLLPNAPRRRAQLPGLAPRVFYYPRAEDPRGAAAAEVPMQCDTLWIDTDRAICTLTWRGVILRPEAPIQLVMALDPRGAPSAALWQDLRADLDRAGSVRALEASDLAAANESSEPGRAATGGPAMAQAPGHIPPPPARVTPSKNVVPPGWPAPAEPGPGRAADAVRTMDLPPVSPRRAPSPPLPFASPPPASAPPQSDEAATTLLLQPDPAPVEPAPFRSPTPGPDPRGATILLGPNDRGAEQALPFNQGGETRAEPAPASAAPISPARAPATTEILFDRPSKEALPFGAPLQPATAGRPAEAPLQAAEAGRQTVALLDPPRREALPFEAASQAVSFERPVEAPLRSVDAARQTLALSAERAARTGPAIPFGETSGPFPFQEPTSAPSSARRAAPPEPSEIDPPPLGLEVYAAIKAEIWEGSAPLDVVLERHGLCEYTWKVHEQRQAEALDREAREGRADAALALAALLKAARAARSSGAR